MPFPREFGRFTPASRAQQASAKPRRNATIYCWFDRSPAADRALQVAWLLAAQRHADSILLVPPLALEATLAEYPRQHIQALDLEQSIQQLLHTIDPRGGDLLVLPLLAEMARQPEELRQLLQQSRVPLVLVR